MPPSSDFEILEYDKKNYIVYLRDLDRGGKSITNDAEQVYPYIRTRYGAVRVVYQDSMGEWTEILSVVDENYPGDWRIAFEPWNGLAWDILKR
jgi:hypothetical protein